MKNYFNTDIEPVTNIIKKHGEVCLGRRGPYFVIIAPNSEPQYCASENYAERVFEDACKILDGGNGIEK